MRIIFIFTLAAVILFNLHLQLYADIHGHLDADGYWSFNNSKDKIKEYNEIIKNAADKFKVESSLIIAIIKTESDFNHTAVSSKGAKGLMQIMPGTASMMNLEEPFSPEENIMAGTRYLSLLLERFNNDKRLALAAYNAGPETVEACNGVPPFPETRNFIHKVFNYYKQYNQRQ
jgi:soluble lytic murein transglycosylase-like protein